MTTTEPHAALNHRCPFCYADPGKACRTHRGRGRELEHPHSRRMRIVHPSPPASRLTALCCECGEQRTVSEDYYFKPSDQNRAKGCLFTDPRGWLETGTLKCSNCGIATRHAVLRKDGLPDYAEKYQHYVLGGEWEGQWAPDREELRARYMAQFPRNPYVHHWYQISDAQAAWEAGERTVVALCGDTMTLHREPKTCRSERGKGDDPVEPEEVRDVEYEEPDTGLWWDDMDCVNCLRVTNERRRRRRRERLESWLAWFSCHPEMIPDADANTLIQVFEPLAETIRQREK